MLLRLQKIFGGRRGPATAVLTIVLLLLVVVPFLAGLGTLLENRAAIAAKVEGCEPAEIPPPPSWLAKVPLVGSHVSEAWQGYAGEVAHDLAAKVAPYARQALNWFVGVLGNVGALFFQLLMTVIVCAVLYNLGDAAAERVRRFARRIAGERARTPSCSRARRSEASRSASSSPPSASRCSRASASRSRASPSRAP